MRRPPGAPTYYIIARLATGRNNGLTDNGLAQLAAYGNFSGTNSHDLHDLHDLPRPYCTHCKTFYTRYSTDLMDSKCLADLDH